uniref:Uncharacterized protein n=1 Tax=Arion vulgaris TaxID=1028688 RepID=A0A0B7AIX7_9EUPU
MLARHIRHSADVTYLNHSDGQAKCWRGIPSTVKVSPISTTLMDKPYVGKTYQAQ